MSCSTTQIARWSKVEQNHSPILLHHPTPPLGGGGGASGAQSASLDQITGGADYERGEVSDISEFMPPPDNVIKLNTRKRK